MEDRKSGRKKSRCKAICRYIYDPKKKKFLNRSCGNWATLLIFYTLFFGTLGGFFVGAIYATKFFIWSEDHPAITRLGGPGLSYRPAVHKKAPLVWYVWDGSGADLTHQDHVDEIDKFLEDYKTSDNDYQHCEKGKDGDLPCFFNTSLLGPCAVSNYGYDQNKPCIYLKLNKVMRWDPDCYDGSSIPDDAPDSLIKVVKSATENKTEDRIWVSCDGDFPADKEHIGEIKYYPGPWFSAYYFPFSRQKGFLSPLIAVQFENPQCHNCPAFFAT